MSTFYLKCAAITNWMHLACGASVNWAYDAAIEVRSSVSVTCYASIAAYLASIIIAGSPEDHSSDYPEHHTYK